MKIATIGSGSKRINLKLFATIDEVLESNKDNFADSPDFGTNFGTISEKLKGLGYDVLLNNRQNGEFIPAARLGEVVSQRDGFKQQAEGLQKQLEVMQKNTSIPEDVQKQISLLSDSNKQLLEQLEDSQVNMEIMACAVDAHNPKDVAAFVDHNKVNIDKQGNVHGVKEEIERIKAEKPYMFKVAENSNNLGSKGGSDNQGGSGSGSGSGTLNMNSMIRRAAGHTF